MIKDGFKLLFLKTEKDWALIAQIAMDMGFDLTYFLHEENGKPLQKTIKKQINLHKREIKKAVLIAIFCAPEKPQPVELIPAYGANNLAFYYTEPDSSDKSDLRAILRALLEAPNATT